MKMKKCIPTLFCFFLNLLDFFKFLFKKAFIHLGLLKPPPPEEDYDSANSFSTGTVLLINSRSLSIVSVPVHVLTAMIKKNLPVLEYGSLAGRFGEDEGGVENTVNKVCTVCLDSMEKNDEMRELCNCSHVFHKDCLDTWVNEGQVTCPLCRSTLYDPEQIDLTGRLPDSWII